MAGAGLAMLIGWVLFPIQQPAVGPASMRADYRAEYVRLVAEAYRATDDLPQAEARLRALDEVPYTAPLVSLAEQWIADGRSEELVVPLVELAVALEVDTPVMQPYLRDRVE